MSWSVSFIARTKGAAVAAIEAHTATEEKPYNIPKGLAEQLKAWVMQIHEERLGTKGAIMVETSGHFSDGQGNATCKIQGVTVEE